MNLTAAKMILEKPWDLGSVIRCDLCNRGGINTAGFFPCLF